MTSLSLTAYLNSVHYKHICLEHRNKKTSILKLSTLHASPIKFNEEVQAIFPGCWLLHFVKVK